MLRKNSIDDVVLALQAAPVDPRTGNKVLYSVEWLADKPSMIGQVNEDWVRRELDWFFSGSDKLEDMEGPVPALFKACAGLDGRVNSAYGHILFSQDVSVPSLFDKVLNTLLHEGTGTRHAVAIISDRLIHGLARLNGRNDFICTNALNFMIDQDNRLHIIAQMRSMDAVFGYRADYSMWDALMDFTLGNLEFWMPDLQRGDITFQVANLHVYPRHFQLLADTSESIEARLERDVWSFRQRLGLEQHDDGLLDLEAE
jgi:hypothetical protein